MKYLFVILASISLFACSKSNDVLATEAKIEGTILVRIVTTDNDGTKTYSAVSSIKM